MALFSYSLVLEIPEDSDGPLKEAHIKALVEFLNPVASRWEDIGIQLGINSRDLDTLKQRGGTTVEAALSHTLKKLDRLEPPKTVGDLFEALSSSTVAEKVYAEHLRDKYGNSQRCVLGKGCLHIYVCPFVCR